VALNSLPQIQLVVAKLSKELDRRREDANRWMRYYRGDQGALLFASEDFRQASGKRYEGFSDNWCQPVASAGAERTALRGLKLPGSTVGKMSPEESAIWGALQDNGADAQFAQAFLQSGIQRRAFVSIWGETSGKNAGQPVIAAESTTQAIVAYDPEVRWRRRFGLKSWVDEDLGVQRATLSDADLIYKLKRPMAALNGVMPSGLIVPSMAGAGWELVEDPIPNHLGLVPLVELPYLPPLEGDPLSVISGVAAMQDAVNLLWAYLFNSADYASLPARVVMGQQPPKVPVLDQDGQKIGERPVDSEELTKGRILWLTGQSASVGQWDAADLKPFTEAIEQIVGHIAAQTRTPPHYLVTKQGMSNLSGDALKAAETGLVMKVITSQEHYEGRIRDIFELISAQLDLGDVGTQRARVQWRDPENRSDAQKADAFQKRQAAGYPFEWLLIEDGKSPDEIEMIMALKQKEQAAALTAGVQDLFRDLTPNPPPAATGAPPEA